MSMEQRLAEWVKTYLATLLGRPAPDIHLDKTLADYGLDSVDAILMAGELEDNFEIEIDPATFMHFESFTAMIAGIASLHHRE